MASRSRVFQVSAFLLALLSATGETPAQVTRSLLRPGGQFGSSVSVGPDGRIHVLYTSRQDRLHHAWGRPGAWQDETVDPGRAITYGCSGAVDSQGRIHVAYHPDNGLGPSQLAYAVRDEAGWTITDLSAGGGLEPTLVIGPGDLPRILHSGQAGNTLCSTFSGVSWSTVDTGIPNSFFMGSSLVLDADGHAHAALGTNTQLYYATDASGNWQATPLGVGGASAGIVLDPLGRPQILAGFYSGSPNNPLVHFRYDGAQWTSETLSQDTDGISFDSVAIVADGAGGILGLASGDVPVRGGSVAGTFLVAYDGYEWKAKVVDVWYSADGVSVARGPDGTVHGTLSRSPGTKSSVVRYVRVRLPNLAATWDEVASVPEGGVASLQGILRVANLGAAVSKSTRVSFFLSDDDVLDPLDERLEVEMKVGPIGPGKARTIPVSLGPISSGGGSRVLAVVDADRRHSDTSHLDDVAVAVLFP